MTRLRRVLITQRVAVEPTTGERRDALDQRWHEFLTACDILPLPIPNDPGIALEWMARVPFDGLLLTGGNDLASRGGDAPERDQTELMLLAHALDSALPVLGVCRGMQLLMERFGIEQVRVEGHVAPRQTIEIHGEPQVVNSYHQWGCHASPPELEVWARAADGVVKAVQHQTLPVVGMMWHPERMAPFRDDDVGLVTRLFVEGAGRA